MKKFVALYTSVLLLAFHFYFFYFINSTYLSEFFTANIVGLLYSLAGVLNLLLFFNVSKLVKKIGNYRLLIALICLEAACLLSLAFSPSLAVIALAFIVSAAINPVMIFNLDIIFESFSKNAKTGGIRGMFLTAMNLPPLICPFIAGLLLATSAYWKIYLVAALFLLPLLYVVIFSFRKFKDPAYKDTSMEPALTTLLKKKDVLDIFIDNLLLNIFYAWMVIYMPIYLHMKIGFSLPQIGALLSIMLVPFILFQLPLGRAADKKYGEKEILITGFTIMIVTTLTIPFLQSANFLEWAILLFSTRIGASFVEVGAETYFFKKVGARDINLIALYRTARALPYAIVPFIVSTTLLFTDIQHGFILLGLLMLGGIRYTLPIRDTR